LTFTKLNNSAKTLVNKEVYDSLDQNGSVWQTLSRYPSGRF